MRIAFFSETFLPKVDGIVNTLCYLLDYLAGQGHKSLLFAPEGSIPHYAHTPVIRYPGLAFPWYPELKLALPTLPLRHQLRHFSADIVHVVNPLSLGMGGIYQARRLRLPVVASFHTDIAGFAAQWGLSALRGPIWTWLRAVHNLADLNLCPSEATLRQLHAHRFNRVKVWTRGVDTHRFHPSRRTAVWREHLSNGRPEAPLLLFVGRLSLEKRADWLLPVLAAIPEARLAIVGDGPARPQLEAQFAGRPAMFTGYLRGEALAQAYAAADMFVFPSPHETLGNVVLEAMASGLPVVVARSGGPLDFVRDGENGLTFAPDDLAELITAVNRLVHAPELRQQLGANARRLAETRSWSQIFNGLITDYQALIQEQTHPRMLWSAGNTGAAHRFITHL